MADRSVVGIGMAVVCVTRRVMYMTGLGNLSGRRRQNMFFARREVESSQRLKEQHSKQG